LPHSPTKYPDRFYIPLSLLALVSGGFIYLFLRTTEPVFFVWLNLHHAYLFASSQGIPEWIVYSLPNGLWAFAYALFITKIWCGSRSWLRTFWMTSIPVLVLGFEFLQYTGIVRGTFCLQDIVLGTAGIIIGVFFGLINLKLNHYENPSE